MFFFFSFKTIKTDFESYSNFFNLLRTKLSVTDTSKLVIGSDEELVLVNAISIAFPDSTHILRKSHLYQNTKQKLVDDSIDKGSRQTFLYMICGDKGPVTTEDSICFELKSEEIERRFRDSKTNQNYFERKLKPNLQDKIQNPSTSGLIETV